MPAGRPTDYRPEFCEQVVEMMAGGASKAEVAAEMCRSYTTFLNWQDAHPEFMEAVKEGERLSQGWWEKLGRQGASGAVPVNPTVYIFNMKNRFRADWSDTHKTELTGANGGPVAIAATDLTDDDLATIAAGSSARATGKA
ncbi:hypothetical protein IP90_00948 [Luteimonas cucumeris]|uniref:Terminase small subunit n=1 Tax=Luteimonas cucumeris TaxID=985012 RepID=A0A562LB07_9GAMM|nr:hypothetical protein [Luteimonas cucumeris]TWI04810.1 hypothetical protein IP90_00948 [Luteimonas cucumeris]